MRTISKYEMRSILGYLDQAAIAIAIRDARELPGLTIESNVARNIRMARERLRDAAIGEVQIEPTPANDTAPIREAA